MGCFIIAFIRSCDECVKVSPRDREERAEGLVEVSYYRALHVLQSVIELPRGALYEASPEGASGLRW